MVIDIDNGKLGGIIPSLLFFRSLPKADAIGRFEIFSAIDPSRTTTRKTNTGKQRRSVPHNLYMYDRAIEQTCLRISLIMTRRFRIDISASLPSSFLSNCGTRSILTDTTLA